MMTIDNILKIKDLGIALLSSPVAAIGYFWLLSGQADNMLWRVCVLFAFWNVVPVCDPNCPLCYIPNVVISYYMWKTRHQYKISNTALAKKFDEKFAWSELSEKFNADSLSTSVAKTLGKQQPKPKAQAATSSADSELMAFL